MVGEVFTFFVKVLIPHCQNTLQVKVLHSKPYFQYKNVLSRTSTSALSRWGLKLWLHFSRYVQKKSLSSIKNMHNNSHTIMSSFYFPIKKCAQRSCQISVWLEGEVWGRISWKIVRRKEVSGEISICHFHSFWSTSQQRGGCQQSHIKRVRRTQNQHSKGANKQNKSMFLIYTYFSSHKQFKLKSMY